MSKTMSKAEAASILADEIFILKETVEKGGVMAREITQDYFWKYKSTECNGSECILLDFNRIGTFASILEDIITDLNEKIKELVSISEESEIKKSGGNAA